MKEDTIKYKTPLVYYGGKQRIASWICSMIPPHRIYVEPFFGGGAVFFEECSLPHNEERFHDEYRKGSEENRDTSYQLSTTHHHTSVTFLA